jgi:membrane fusion protein, macrolide-specific efflux system
MIRRTTWLVTAAAIAAFAIAGCGGSSVSSAPSAAPASSANPANPASSASAPPASPLTAAPASPKSGDPSEILSVLSVEHQVDVAAQRDGPIVSLAKDEGSVVKAGDILGQVDDRSLQMELVKAKDDLQVSQNNVKYKEAELKAKGAAYKRQQQLRNLGLSSEADLEAAEFAAKAAEYDMHGWEALVESSHAEIHRLEIEIDQTRLHAPFAGVVVRRYVREGQSVAKGEKCLRLSQLAPLQVQFQIPESSAHHPDRGTIVEVSLVDNPKRSFTARIAKVSPTIDPASDSYDVTAQLIGPGISDLRPGMAVRVLWQGAAHAKP